MTLTDASGKPKLWLRSLSSDVVQPLEGTEGALFPFWSPDSRYIGFFSADGKLRKVPASGGPAESVCDQWFGFGSSWSSDGVIVIAVGISGFFRVPASGGTPVQIRWPEKYAGDYRWPAFLPDGRHFLVTSNDAAGGIFAVSLDNGEMQPVLPEESSPARYAEPGYLLFLHGDSLMAQLFDLRTLRVSGTAQRLAESVYNGLTSFSTSSTGLLLYQRSFQTQLTWVDPAGNKIGAIGAPGHLSAPYLSPDDQSIVVTVTDSRQNRQKLWLYDLRRGTAGPFTFGDGNDLYPVWSPNGRQVAFTSTRAGKEDIYVKDVSGGTGEQPLFQIEGNAESDRWSKDGRFLLFDYTSKKTSRGDIWAIPLFGDRKPFPVVQTRGTDIWGTFSPDAKWVAYESDESGRGEIYVVPFPGPGGKWQISTSGGIIPVWPPGKELFYVTPDLRVIAVEFEVQGSNFLAGKSRELFGGRAFGGGTGFDVAHDGKRFLFTLPVDEPNASPLILTTNWTAALSH